MIIFSATTNNCFSLKLIEICLWILTSYTLILSFIFEKWLPFLWKPKLTNQLSNYKSYLQESLFEYAFGCLNANSAWKHELTNQLQRLFSQQLQLGSSWSFIEICLLQFETNSMFYLGQITAITMVTWIAQSAFRTILSATKDYW